MKTTEQKLQALGTLRLSCGIKYEDYCDIKGWHARGSDGLDDKAIERVNSLYERFFQE